MLELNVKERDRTGFNGLINVCYEDSCTFLLPSQIICT